MPLMISAYEGNTAETKMMIPTLKKFMATHGLSEVIIVADAGMISEANWKAIEAEGFSFILGQRLPHLPYVIEKWQRDNPGTDYEDGQVWAAREPVGTGKHNRADHVTYYQWKSGRARRTLDGIDKQVTKAAPRSPDGPRSNATGSSSSRAPPSRSTGNSRPRPDPWPA